ncbi:protein kinase domain-containing protein [Actinomadura madurae]|uniref:protein kinase domain-containing protein n=1 Tax=Actinomadura madurae TaxID=1993 RepID=UPI002026C82D|nr:protein kinase [Actinomadura madurae]MCP9984098.1 protein kinase [Actinomadura madurae]URN00347.1 protein kinase [Actinomadura madurae]URN02499.1 protein kinase [Actinomadura madurae]
MPHDTSRGRTTVHPARAAARPGRPAQPHGGRAGRPGKPRPSQARSGQGRAGPPRPAQSSRYLTGGEADGPRLQEVVDARGPLSGPRLRKVAARTAAALAAMHRAGVVHHDLKPANVLLGPDGAKVVDLGAGRLADAAGTPAYMAPEQIEDEPAGPPADVFAWGATMVFAATGRPPFGTGPSTAVMRRVTSRRPDLGEMHGPLRDLAVRCLDKNPAARPTAPQVVRALREGQGPAPKPRPTKIPRYRWRMMVALGAVIAAGFALGMLF